MRNSFEDTPENPTTRLLGLVADEGGRRIGGERGALLQSSQQDFIHSWLVGLPGYSMSQGQNLACRTRDDKSENRSRAAQRILNLQEENC
jgi:hypothetical protein